MLMTLATWNAGKINFLHFYDVDVEAEELKQINEEKKFDKKTFFFIFTIAQGLEMRDKTSRKHWQQFFLTNEEINFP